MRSGFVNGELFTAYYNRGGYFVEARGHQNTSTLAFYDIKQTLPAIIQCQVGQGIAILSGVHFEYDPFLLDSQDPYLEKILPNIVQGNKQRELLLTHLLERLLFH